MDLVLLTQHFAPRFEGGTEAVARAQARELARLGHRVRIVSGTDQAHAGQDVERESVEGLEVAFVPRRPDEPYDLTLERPRVGERVEELLAGADLVHVHHWATLTLDLVRRAARHAPTVVTLHDYFLACPRFFRLPPDSSLACPPPLEFGPCLACVAPEAPGVPPGRLAEGFGARNASARAEVAAAARVVVPSRAHGEGVAPLVGLEPGELVVVPHGLDRPPARRPGAWWGGDGPQRVLVLGHRSPVKGVSDLVSAVAGLDPALRSRVELVFLGDEVEPGFDAELARLGEGVRMRFDGDYTAAELGRRAGALAPLHLGAFPSRAWESYGLVPDELQALGLPVWVTDRGAPKERVGTAGRVLAAADPAAWSAALREVLTHPDALERERQSLPSHPRTARHAARELEALYRSVLGA